MKNKAIYGSLLLGACIILGWWYSVSQKHTDTQGNTINSASISTVARDGSGNIIPIAWNPLGTSGKISKIPSPEEKKAIENIMNSPNFSICEKETTEASKTQCKDRILFMRATLQKNPLECETIKDPGTLGTCVAGTVKVLSGAIVENPCTKLTNPTSKESCSTAYLTMQAQLSYDTSLCDKIQENKARSMCKNKVLISEAIEKKDSKICLQITEATLQKNCTSIIK